MIVLIAICIIGFFDACKHREWKLHAIHALLIAGGIFLSTFTVSFAYLHFGYEVNPEKTFGPAHFLAMGLNEDSMGIWAAEDVNYSEAFLTAEERTEASWYSARSRFPVCPQVRNSFLRGRSKQWG